MDMWHPDMPEEYRNQIVTGDARELAKRIPDESVDLIFTDPVYDRIDDYRWLAETAVRVLRLGGDLLTYSANMHVGLVLKTIMESLDFRGYLVEKKMTSTVIWHYRLFCHTIPVLWFTKGDVRDGLQRIDFMWVKPNGKMVNHRWAKSTDRAYYWLNKFGLPDDCILDPFCGGGSIIAGSKMLGRNYVAFEIDPDMAEKARERVRNTQPPLFVLEPEQMELSL